MGKLIPILLILLGLGAGLGAGLVLRPVPETDTGEISPPDPAPQPVPSGVETGIFEFGNQFMVPLVEDGRITAVIVVKLAIEIAEGQRATVVANTPRLRDALLQVMFDHANIGGFQGAFTAQNNLALLRRSLLEAAQHRLGADIVFEVLITDLLRTGS